MGSVENHYENLLAEHYTWMLGGDIEQVVLEQRSLLDRLGVLPTATGQEARAVDLGCGSGAQTLALADLGFSDVLGVDSNPALLAEVRDHAADRTGVQTSRTDLLEALADLEPGSVDAIVCMGDTVLHLPDRAAVNQLITGAAAALRPEGAVALSYRDLTPALHGLDRFIPVRSTSDQIMLCFLDHQDDDTVAQDDDTVAVHDLVYTRAGNEWQLTKSSYPKLRLAPTWIAEQLTTAGLRLDWHEPGATGMWITVARQPTDTR